MKLLNTFFRLYKLNEINKRFEVRFGENRFFILLYISTYYHDGNENPLGEVNSNEGKKICI